MILFFLTVTIIFGYFMIINSSLEQKSRLISEKIIASILSALLISVYFTYSLYTPVESEEAGNFYASFQGKFIFSLFVSLPIYLIYGTVYSFFIDSYLRKVSLKNPLINYFTQVFLYVFGGALFIAIILIYDKFTSTSIMDFYDLSLLFMLGILPALLFYHILLLIKLMKKTWKLIGKLTR